MRNLYKGIVSAAIIGMSSYLTTPDSAYSQTLASTQFGVPKQKADTVQTQKDTTKKVPQIKTVENRIMMRNPASTFSATGRGISLTNYVYDITLTPDSKYNLDSAFIAVRGPLYYNASDIRESIQYELNDVKNEKPQTPKTIASRRYLEGLLRNTPKSDQASLNLIRRAVQDGYVDVVGDSLFVDGQWRIKPGLYTIVAETEKTTTVGKTKYVKNSLPTPARIGFQTQTAPYDTAVAKAREDSIAARNRYLGDSTATARADSIANAEVEKARQAERERAKARVQDIFIVGDTAVAKARERARKPLAYQPKKETPKKSHTHNGRLRLEPGLEAMVGSNEEGVIGGFANLYLSKTVSVGAYADFYFLRGKDPISWTSSTDTTVRAVKFVGPATYEHRVDRITTKTEDEPKAEFGLGLSFRSGNLVFPVRAGTVLSGREESKEGESDVWFERNKKQLGEKKTISNTMEGESSNSTNFAFSLGADYKFNNNLSGGLSFNRTGNKNSARLVGRVYF